MKKIAITGGIGSGKSTVLEIVKSLGYPVFSCDEIYKEITKSAKYIQKVQEIFPDAVNNEGIDKQILSKLIFNDDSLRQKLNQISHPIIMEKLFEQMGAVTSTLVFAEVPLLFEGHFENLFDVIIVVKRNMQSRIDAVAARDQILAVDVQNRIKSQFCYESKEGESHMKNCNAYILFNDDSIETLSYNIKEILNEIGNS